MKMSETRALYNRRALARLTRATPEIFRAPVLIHVHGLRWTPPMPRIAADSYWRAHVLRADRLARALATMSGAPAGWTWRVGPKRGLPQNFRQPPAPYREPKFARGPGFCCVCGQPVYRFADFELDHQPVRHFFRLFAAIRDRFERGVSFRRFVVQ